MESPQSVLQIRKKLTKLEVIIAFLSIVFSCKNDETGTLSNIALLNIKNMIER